MDETETAADDSVAAGLKQAFQAELAAAEADLDKLTGLQGVVTAFVTQLETAVAAVLPTEKKTAAA